MKTFRVIVLSGIIFGLFTFGLGMPTVVRAAPQTNCPVLGAKINKKIFVDYKGQRIYFCCKGCVAQFKKDPEKYLKKMKAQGVTPEKTP